MRNVILISLLLATPLQTQKEPMVAAKVTHHKEVTTQEYDRVYVSCPDWYEGHLVDIPIGFDTPANSIDFRVNFDGPVGYAVCFKRDFMDELRKNPDLLRARPQIRPV